MSWLITGSNKLHFLHLSPVGSSLAKRFFAISIESVAAIPPMVSTMQTRNSNGLVCCALK